MKAILAPWEFERLCRRSLAKKPKRSIVPIQHVIELSMLPAGEWCPAMDIHSRLRRTDLNIGGTFDQAIDQGWVVVEKRLSDQTYRDTNFFQLGAGFDTVALGGLHGDVMQKIREALTVYCMEHSSATPLVGLLLLSIFRHDISLTSEITRFLELEIVNPSFASRVAREMADMGLFTLVELGGGAKSKLMICRY